MTVDEVLKILKDDCPEAYEELEELMKIKVSQTTMDKIMAAIVKPVPPDRPILSGEREDGTRKDRQQTD